MELVGSGGATSDPAKMPAVQKDPAFTGSICELFIKMADQFNEPGKFTAFIGYEWTSMPGADNLHRCVVFRDGAERAIRTLPYVRAALKNGLKLKQDLGANPFKFGMIGSTDSHVGIPAVEEDNYFGKMANYEPNPHRAEHVALKLGDLKIMGWDLSASGYAAVWAMENSRGHLGRDEAQGSLCHHRLADASALFRRLGL